MLTADLRQVVQIFCGGRRVLAELIDGNRYRCRGCGNEVRAVNVWAEASSSVRQFRQKAGRR